MTYQIKISGIDANQNKHLWLNIHNISDTNTSHNIRINPKQEERSNESKTLHLTTNILTDNLIPDNSLTDKFSKLNINTENNIKQINKTKEIKREFKEIKSEFNKIKGEFNQIKGDFNNDQENAVKLIKSNIDLKTILVITGVAGSGKSYTILNTFNNINVDLSKKKICFSAPTNSVVEASKKHKKTLEQYFKKVDYFTTSALLGEKCVYDNNGDKSFVIRDKYIKIDKYDIVVIDEVSMVKKQHIDYIKNNHKSLFILLGDKNQLDPVESSDTSILDNYNISLTQNMRCSDDLINKINLFLIHNIENYKNNYINFINEFYKLAYNLKNDKNIYVIHKQEDLIELYIKLYKNDLTIIGNYKNETCVKLNNSIQEQIIFNNNISCIDNYFVGQQIVFLEAYEDYNTSDFDTIENIKTSKYVFEIIDSTIFIKNIENTLLDSKQIDKYYEKIKDEKCTSKLCNTYTIEDKNLYKYQVLFNYLISISKTNKNIRLLFKKMNDFEDVYVNMITLQKNKIKVLHSNYITKHINLYNSIKKDINNLNKLITKSQLKIKNFYNTFIIQTLYYILDKYRIDIFAKISSAFSCTIHRLQGCSIQNMFVNVEDIFKMLEDKNKLKCLYTAISRCSKILVLYLPMTPLCKCDIFVKEIFRKNINTYMCNNKNKNCGFLEDKCIENSNCGQCNNCSKIYFNHMLDNNICYLCK